METLADLFQQQLQRCEWQLIKYPQDELLMKALASVKNAVAMLPRSSEDPSCREEGMKDPSCREEGMKEPSCREERMKDPSCREEGMKDPSCREEGMKDPSCQEAGMKEPLQSYTQSILDSTYHEESQLVREEFPPNSAQNRISAIIGAMCAPTRVCGSPDRARSLMGVELVECLHWRVGALMYMYCHTMATSEGGRREANKRHFVECCSVGVGHLKLMLTTRTPLQSGENYSIQDASVAELLQKGIFSDIHMLGLMYAGELCYWAWESGAQTQLHSHRVTQADTQTKLSSPTTTGSQSTSHRHTQERPQAISTNDEVPTASRECSGLVARGNGDDREKSCMAEPVSFYCLMEHLQGREFIHKWKLEFNAIQCGQEFLTKYIDTARGPLKPQGWSYDRAVKLLVKLKRADREAC